MAIGRIMTLVFLIDLLVLAILGFFLFQPVSYTEYQGDGFTCSVPAGEQTLPFEQWGWHKHHFTGKGELYVSHRPLSGTFEEEAQELGQYLQGAAFQQEIRVVDDGRFFVFSRGKSWRKYVYLFSVDQEVFWVENLGKHSTMLTYKEVADRVLTTLVVGEQASHPSLPVAIANINREILWISQSPMLLFRILAGFLVGVSALVASLLSLSGAIPPRSFGPIAIRQEGNIYLVTRSPGKYQGTFGALVLTSEALTLFCFKRPVVTLSRGEREKISLEQKRGKTFLVIQEGNKVFQIHVADPYVWMNDIGSHL